MAKFDYDIGIIGGGAAGLTVASGAGQLGAKTLLVEREPQLGGDCLHFGCVPSKTLIRSAQIYHESKHAACYGLPKIRPGAVDFSKISARIAAVIGKIQQHDSVERFNGLGVEVQFGEARFKDEQSIELDGKRLSAAKWVIATGSSTAIPAINGLADTEIITNRELFSLAELPRSIVVLGAGAIAMEMAQSFARLGSQVTVVQRSSQVLSKEDQDMAAIVQAGLERDGVSFYLGCQIKKVSQNGAEKRVSIVTAEGEERDLVATQLLLALGRSIDPACLDLARAGVAWSATGVRVDNRLRTTQKHIFAAGDVIGGYQFTHAAGYEGGIVLTNAILRLPRRVNYRWMPWCTYTAPALASIGMNETRAHAAGLAYTIHEELFANNDRAQAEGAVAGKIKLLLNAKEKPIGVQIAGLHAAELLGEWVVGLNSGTRLATIAGAIHPYPTMAEINKRVVGGVLSKKLFSNRVRKLLKLLFRYRG